MALALGIELAWAPVEIFGSMVGAMVKLQQETWAAVTESATSGLRELTTD